MGHDVVDEAQLLALGGAHMSAGQNHAQRALRADLPRQAVESPCQRSQAHLRLRQREDRLVGSDDQIAGQRDLEPATHGNAVDRSDDRLGQIEPGGEARETSGHRYALAALRLIAKVVAGAEAPTAAGDDGNPHVVVGGEVVEYLTKLGIGGRVQRVQAIRSVQGDGHHVVLLVDQTVLRHGGLSFLFPQFDFPDAAPGPAVRTPGGAPTDEPDPRKRAARGAGSS